MTCFSIHQAARVAGKPAVGGSSFPQCSTTLFSLTDDLLILILKKLSIPNLFILRRVCKEFRKRIDESGKHSLGAVFCLDSVLNQNLLHKLGWVRDSFLGHEDQQSQRIWYKTNTIKPAKLIWTHGKTKIMDRTVLSPSAMREICLGILRQVFRLAGTTLKVVILGPQLMFTGIDLYKVVCPQLYWQMAEYCPQLATIVLEPNEPVPPGCLAGLGAALPGLSRLYCSIHCNGERLHDADIGSLLQMSAIRVLRLKITSRSANLLDFGWINKNRWKHLVDLDLNAYGYQIDDMSSIIASLVRTRLKALAIHLGTSTEDVEWLANIFNSLTGLSSFSFGCFPLSRLPGAFVKALSARPPLLTELCLHSQLCSPAVFQAIARQVPGIKHLYLDVHRENWTTCSEFDKWKHIKKLSGRCRLDSLSVSFQQTWSSEESMVLSRLADNLPFVTRVSVAAELPAEVLGALVGKPELRQLDFRMNFWYRDWDKDENAERLKDMIVECVGRRQQLAVRAELVLVWEDFNETPATASSIISVLPTWLTKAVAVRAHSRVELLASHRASSNCTIAVCILP